MPLTFMQTFCSGANLKAELSDNVSDTLPALRAALREVKLIAMKWFSDSFSRSGSNRGLDGKRLGQAFDAQENHSRGTDQTALAFDDKVAEPLLDHDYTALLFTIQHTPTPGFQYISSASPTTQIGYPLMNLINAKREVNVNGVRYTASSSTSMQGHKNSLILFRSISGQTVAENSMPMIAERTRLRCILT